MDEFYEQLLYEDHSRKIKLVKVLQIIILLIAAISLFQRNIIGMIVAVVAVILTLVYSNRKLVEFEYHLCADEFRIYKIICESRRVLIDRIDLNNIKKVSKVSDYLKSDGALDCYVGDKEQYTLLMITNMRRGEYHKYVVALDRRMLNNLKRINPGVFIFF